MFSSAPVFQVSRIMSKLLSRFSQNSVERWHMGRGRNREILVVIGSRYVSVKVRLRLGGWGRDIPSRPYIGAKTVRASMPNIGSTIPRNTWVWFG